MIERLRLVLPQSAHTSQWIQLRLDALPLAAGAAEIQLNLISRDFLHMAKG